MYSECKNPKCKMFWSVFSMNYLGNLKPKKNLHFVLCQSTTMYTGSLLQYSNFNIAIWYQKLVVFQKLISVLTFQSIFWQLSLQYNACLHPPHLRKGFFLVLLFALLNVEGPSTNAGAHHSTIHSWPFSSFKTGVRLDFGSICFFVQHVFTLYYTLN